MIRPYDYSKQMPVYLSMAQTRYVILLHPLLYHLPGRCGTVFLTVFHFPSHSKSSYYLNQNRRWSILHGNSVFGAAVPGESCKCRHNAANTCGPSWLDPRVPLPQRWHMFHILKIHCFLLDLSWHGNMWFASVQICSIANGQFLG